MIEWFKDQGFRIAWTWRFYWTGYDATKDTELDSKGRARNYKNWQNEFEDRASNSIPKKEDKGLG